MRGWSLVGVVALFVSGAPISAQVIRPRAGDYTAVPGAAIEVPLEIETAEPLVTGFSFGVRHDATKLGVGAVTASDALLEAMGLPAGSDPSSDFFLIDLEPEGGGGFIVAAILSSMDAAVGLAPGVHHLFTVRYDALGTATGTAEVAMSADVGSPPVALVVDVAGGTARAFDASSINIGFAPGFRRGDSNGDGRYNLGDAIAVLFYLFQGGAVGNCPVALNVDGSTRAGGGDPQSEDLNDIQITDAIQLLQFLFGSGVPPASPFEACGQSPAPVAEAMRCLEFDACL